jgi:two-component system, chemotaxis family, CheB/CheR fusion protein
MVTPDSNPKFEDLLDYLRRIRGFDFTGYKRTSLMRRVNKRMELQGIQDFGDYTDYLEVHPEEFIQLFNTILINVTGFFRDGPAWEFLAKDVLPKILESRTALRIWCAGVASGEEAYTIAILLAEAMGTDQFLERAKIYATDVDDEALNQARQASYTADNLEAVPEEWRRRYFEAVGNRFVFRADLRRAVIFGRHDLIQDAPISRLDLLICRNTLMYFNLETQSRILARLHFALREDGYLFLGKAEMLLTHADLFAPLDLRFRIFTKIPHSDLRERVALIGLGDERNLSQRLANQIRIREGAFEVNPTAQIVVDLNGMLVMANDRARMLFAISPKDIGHPFSQLELSYRPVELRSPIEQAQSERRPITIDNVERRLPNDTRQYFDIGIIPIEDNDSTQIGISVTFTDTSLRYELQQEVQRSKQDLETAYEELQSANEELETTNEELQSTVEELQTTNEELQSSHEELETMNEELQSTNEEQEATNMELRQRTNDLDDSNAFLSSILGSLQAGVVVVDQNLNVVVWNRAAEDLWGVRVEEVRGRSIFQLDTGLPVDRLAGTIRACLIDDCTKETLVLPATNRRGRQITCRVTTSGLLSPRLERHGVIMLMEEESHTA